MKRRLWLLLLLLLGAAPASNAQNTPSSTSNDIQTSISSSANVVVHHVTDLQDSLAGIGELPARYFDKVSTKAGHIDKRLSSRTAKALRRLQRQEEKIYSKLSRIDSASAHNLFTSSIDSLSHLQQMVKGRITRVTSKIPGGQYIPYLDSLQGSLNFINKYKSRLGQFQGIQQKLQNSLGSVTQLEGKLNQLQDVQQYIQQRKQLLTKALSSYGGIFSKNLGKIKNEAYYFRAHVENYKQLWEHPDKIEAKAMGLLNKVPAFSSFMKEHSELASLFKLPANYGSDASLQGLQTRAMVAEQLQQRLQSAGADGRQQIQQQMQQAKSKLQELKDKLPGGGSAAQMPDFQPKDIKSKPWLRRLEYGANIQFGRGNGILPTTSDLAGQVAYKFSKNGSAGLGMSFKLGWGTNIRKIHFTAQGFGLRSFINYRLKGTFYINGGFEFDHASTIPNMPALKDLNGWSKSALLGIERKYKISSKLNGDVMLLFDFLYKQHVPRTQPLVFRTGYTF